MTKPVYRVKAGSNRIGDDLNGLAQASSGLVNSRSGLGGSSDKGALGTWYFNPLEPQQIEAAYRSNWMARKAVDIPAFDMMREGWSWTGNAELIKKIEKAEKARGIYRIVYRALSMARLYGGSGIVLGDGSNDVSKPLDYNLIARGGLSYVVPLSRLELGAERLELDPRSKYFGKPTAYVFRTATGITSIDTMHPSRVIRFTGNEIPRAGLYENEVWGDSILDAIEIAIRSATAGQQGISSLIQEAAVDVMKIPGLMDRISDPRYLEAFRTRVNLAMSQKSINNALLLDASEEHTTKTLNFSSLNDIAALQILLVSGAADIPATRFLGQSPNGLNATGDSDIRNYYDGLSARQNLFIREPLQELLNALVVDAIRAPYPDDLEWEFRPLWQMDEKERAEINKTNAETAKTYFDAGLIPTEPLIEGVTSRVIEDQVFPALESAMEKYRSFDDLEPGGEGEPMDEVDDLEDLEDDPERDRISDAAPRSLYVYRQVMNADELHKWAKAQGFKKVLSADDMHCTLAHSAEPVDWMKGSDSFEWAEDATHTIKEGGPRIVEPLGDKGAVVLHFASSSLAWRHEDIKEKTGARWGFDEYQPHITITYEAPDLDLDKVEPYRGKIVLGPEIFEEVKSEFTPQYKQFRNRSKS
jgi:phage-related protein (TIGR01555 family)